MTYQRPVDTSCNPGWMYAERPEDMVPRTSDPLGLGARMVRITGNVRVSQGPHAGKRFGEIALPFQNDLTRYMWGARGPDGARLVKKVVLVMGKGGAKSYLAAVWALSHGMDLTMRKVCSRMVIPIVAASIPSANITFEHVAAAITLDDELRPQWSSHTGKREWKHKRSGIVIKVLAPDMAAAVGLRTAGLFVDEVHIAAQDRHFTAVIDQLRRGSSNAFEEFVEVNISTAPTDVAQGYFAKMWAEATRQRDQGGDESLLPVLYTFPLQERPDLELSDSAQWWRAIPSIGFSQPVEAIQREFDQAVASSDPQDMSLFLSQRMCIPPDHRSGVDAWHVASAWPALPRCAPNVDPSAGIERPTVAIDIGGSDDLAAVVLVYQAGQAVHVHERQYCIRDAITRAHPNTRETYQAAIDAGELTVHETVSAMEEALLADCRELAQALPGIWFGGDQYGLAGFGARFRAYTGHEFRTVKQSFNLQAAKARLEGLVADRLIAHEHRPLMQWNLANVRITEGAGGGLRFGKADAGASGQGQRKIDAAMALLSAVELFEHPDRAQSSAQIVAL